MRQIAIAALLSACYPPPAPQNPTPYQPMQWDGGYSDRRLGQGMIEIEVKGNAYTAPGKVLAYAYRRANELCEDGYDIVDRDASTSDSTTAESGGSVVPIGTMAVSRRTTTVTTMSKPQVTLIVRCKAADKSTDSVSPPGTDTEDPFKERE